MKNFKQLIYVLTAIVSIVVLFIDKKFDINPAFYEVIEVVDGDTIAVNMAGSEELIRFIGVNTPETHHPDIGAQCFGDEATNYLKESIGRSKVLLVADPESTNRDRYDRLLRHVYVNGKYLNLDLVTKGYGFATVRFKHSFNDIFLAAETSAQVANRGLWLSCDVLLHPDGYFQTQTLSNSDSLQP